MTPRPKHLPDYKSPPVAEVALSVQFETLKNYKTVHAGLLWESFRKNFSNFEEKQQLELSFETFGAQEFHIQKPSVQLLMSPPSTRLWFVNHNDTQLIQFQPDMFAHNWRKIGDKDTYPRYEAMRKEFLSGIRKLKKFAKNENLGNFVPNQVEVSYVNHILSENGENLPSAIGKIFKCWNNKRYNADLGKIELSRFQSKFVISDNSGSPIGRLHATAEPVSLNGVSAIQFILMVKGRPSKPTLRAIEDFMDMGRERIVLAFTEMTTPEMHKRWERRK